MEEAFHQHDTTSPGGPETSAFSASHWTKEHDTPADTGGTAQASDDVSPDMPAEQMQKHCQNPRQATTGQQVTRARASPAEAELVALLPSLAPAALLVDNYFDRVHWFMLVFHKSDFRQLFRRLYRELDEHRRPQSTSVGLGSLAVFAAVCIVSLRYINGRQRARLIECGIQPDVLQQQLLTTLRLRLLEIVSRGCIEAVQVCVLLGSFHLYHGEPELAWPICGCGLRIAQALDLHRRRPQVGGTGPPDLDDLRQRAEETRKRCWWAVYEIETTCSMLYGFPLSINDDDCDVQLLNPYPLRSGDASWDSAARQETGQATLLSYKHAMAQLAIIVKAVLTDLYGLRRRGVPTSINSGTADRQRLQGLMTTCLEPFPNLNNPDKLSERAFQHHLFQLQALALKVAFENAKILIHRRLLSYRMVVSPTKNNNTTASTISATADTYQSSIQVCREAALEISNIGSLPVFQGLVNTYAVSFVSLHLLTAAIVLSILTTLTPLTQESHDCKMGIRRLMEMQSRLKARSIVAEQGLGILKKLMSLVLTKEMKEMLEFPRSGDEAVPAVVGVERGGDNHIDGVHRDDPNAQASGVERQTGTQDESYQTRSHSQGQPHNSVPSDAAAMAMPVADSGDIVTPGFNFYEDPTITQALLDFEQAIICLPDESTAGTLSLADAEYSTSSCFSIQDQSWIWDSNHFSR
ncbi:hypothetical protein N8I77_000175 [Diaporthe amygdali]|uniref:Xylanolytic transcriptional activator regulatory domain-containing protein n=1 Tax=Phomopsis amygdali TaxID=1214568 RepID=A0AAD9SMU4_PHOAM|nr:hypothetical protein N8I77_000175 [Diaporthe amygdali]